MKSLRSAFKDLKIKSDKRVTFESDTNFERGRSSAEYSRSSKYYKPGSHAVLENDELEDTSFFQIIHFNFTQLKVHTNTPFDINQIMDSCKAPNHDQNEGIVDHHPRCSEINSILDEYNQDNEEMKEFLGRATWLLLAVDDDELVEIFLHQTLECHEAQSEHDEMVEILLQQAVENGKNQSYIGSELIGPSDEEQMVTPGSDLGFAMVME